MSLRLSIAILPIYRWAEGRKVWKGAEELGFHTAYTYDHLSWRVPFRDRTWFGALPTLTAAAGVTESIRLGTLVTSPNFRHPVPLAKELMTLDDISGGRVTLGVGAGGTGFDATVLGQQPWTPRERADRFAEFVEALDLLLSQPATSFDGRSYSAVEARNIPGSVQTPRLPFAVAATGPRGMRLAAKYGQAWVTTGDPALYETGTAEESLAAIRGQIERLAAALTDASRDPGSVPRILLTGFTPDRTDPFQSVDAFVDFAGRHAEAGITEIVVHWPIPDSDFAYDRATLERIALDAPGQLS
ncbi:LLM class flavin-dependent oxidoreductase [Actinacidiphila bryophytorum]|uniref:Luciferase-like monooxygenase n=1 Tax=Actinacidiphila bryophytorum TaxID=1436133 RepID=A0A9W4H530_9ACTN|nr:LLM class flavin-dependent oxidoreductase [Actinacidiphila bryophytorum]MBM9437239.1 LLM class flavin-dependent oxidoreductase [Actinacidiphila bryophytorum]MBN6541759.1 LLM class flavin-dependent oxidoreductase [Actinacidiphila bryophytorum]CAG7651222.1 Luciferase-like monooxygenase [Actinacidiphila bryophytorum]